jgi:hypothetical protein
MDETKYEFPAWLPWATVACLAAVAACLCELWLVQRSRSELLREQGQMAAADAQASANQLEAERILEARLVHHLSERADPDTGLQIVLLASPAGPSAPAADRSAVVVLDPLGGRGQCRLFGSFAQPGGRDYELWIDGPGPGYPFRCGTFHIGEGEARTARPVGIRANLSDGCRFLLFEGPSGGSGSLEGARDAGSIVLASTPYSGKISGR